MLHAHGPFSRKNVIPLKVSSLFSIAWKADRSPLLGVTKKGDLRMTEMAISAQRPIYSMPDVAIRETNFIASWRRNSVSRGIADSNLRGFFT
jgi:hypothetical protein